MKRTAHILKISTLSLLTVAALSCTKKREGEEQHQGYSQPSTDSAVSDRNPRTPNPEAGTVTGTGIDTPVNQPKPTSDCADPSQLAQNDNSVDANCARQRPDTAPAAPADATRPTPP